MGSHKKWSIPFQHVFFSKKKHIRLKPRSFLKKWGERPLQRFAVATIQRNRHAQGIVGFQWSQVEGFYFHWFVEIRRLWKPTSWFWKLVVYPTIYKIFDIWGGLAGFLNRQQYGSKWDSIGRRLHWVIGGMKRIISWIAFDEFWGMATYGGLKHFGATSSGNWHKIRFRDWVQFRQSFRVVVSTLPWEPITFIFRGCSPYFKGLEPAFFTVLGSKGGYIFLPMLHQNLTSLSFWDKPHWTLDPWTWFRQRSTSSARRVVTFIPQLEALRSSSSMKNSRAERKDSKKGFPWDKCK